MNTDSSTVDTQTDTQDLTTDANETLQESSTEEQLNVSDANTAESSATEKEDAKPESMFDAITAALEPDKKESSPLEEPEKEEATEETETEAKAEDDVPFHEHPRWQEMLSENRELKEQAQYGTDLQDTVSQMGLSQDELVNGLELMHLMKTDPHRAREAFMPVMDELDKVTGNGSLNEDLQTKVEAGSMSEDDAYALQQAKASKQHAETQMRQMHEADEANEARAQQQQMQELVGGMTQAVTTWEESWKNSDPDFNKKHSFVKARVVEKIQAEGPPTSIEAAVELSKKARTEVEAELKSMMPVPKAKRTVTGGNSVETKPQPSSLLDVVRNAASTS